MRPLAALVIVLALAGLAAAEPGPDAGARAAEGTDAGVGLSAPVASTAPPIRQALDSDLVQTWEHAQVFLRYEDDQLNLRVISGPLNQPYMQRLLALHNT